MNYKRDDLNTRRQIHNNRIKHLEQHASFINNAKAVVRKPQVYITIVDEERIRIAPNHMEKVLDTLLDLNSYEQALTRLDLAIVMEELQELQDTK